MITNQCPLCVIQFREYVVRDCFIDFRDCILHNRRALPCPIDHRRGRAIRNWIKSQYCWQQYSLLYRENITIGNLSSFRINTLLSSQYTHLTRIKVSLLYSIIIIGPREVIELPFFTDKSLIRSTLINIKSIRMWDLLSSQSSPSILVGKNKEPSADLPRADCSAVDVHCSLSSSYTGSL